MDGQEKVKASYHSMLNLLYPPYIIGRTMSPEITSRIERAFTKASHAFSVLGSFARRSDYDSALLSIANKANNPRRRVQFNQPKPMRAVARTQVDASAVSAETYDLNINGTTQTSGGVFLELPRSKGGDNRRRCDRFQLSIPARVTGYDRKQGKWSEMTETLDVSRTGVRLRLRRRVKHGTVLFVTLHLPAKLRAHGFAEQSYNVYTLVRRVEPPRQGVRLTGVEFLGEHPPNGFLDKPWATFRAKRWGGNDRRRPNRVEQSEIVKLEYFDENMSSIGKEQARTENISRSGLRISGTTAPHEFDLVVVSCARLAFESYSALRNRYLGKDGRERLCLQLIDKEWPARG